MKFSKIVSGSGCPECARLKKSLSEEFVSGEIRKRGGKLVSNYINSKDKIDVLCGVCNNVWSVSFSHIKTNNSWCPCCKSGKSEKLLLDILKSIFSENNGFEVIHKYRGFDWLRQDKSKKQEIDFFICNKDKSFTIGIEYDGQQHFYPVRFGGMSEKKAIEKFEYVKMLDKNKNRLVVRHKKDLKCFIRIPHTEKLNISNIKHILLKKGIKEI